MCVQLSRCTRWKFFFYQLGPQRLRRQPHRLTCARVRSRDGSAFLIVPDGFATCWSSAKGRLCLPDRSHQTCPRAHQRCQLWRINKVIKISNESSPDRSHQAYASRASAILNTGTTSLHTEQLSRASHQDVTHLPTAADFINMIGNDSISGHPCYTESASLPREYTCQTSELPDHLASHNTSHVDPSELSCKSSSSVRAPNDPSSRLASCSA